MTQIPGEVVEYIGKVAEWLKSAPSAGWAGGSLYIGELHKTLKEAKST